MQITPQEFLPLAEKAGLVCAWDLETTGREADYHSILCSSIKPYGRRAQSYTARIPGEDAEVVAWTKAELEKYLVWVTYYGRGFDILFLQTRILKHRLPMVRKAFHFDLYWAGKSHLLTGRRSQAHLIEWLETPNKKMTLSPDMWNKVIANPAKNMPIIKARCEMDCAGAEGLYDRLKTVVKDITR